MGSLTVNDNDPMEDYRLRLEELRVALSQRQRWLELPALLDRLDQARRRVLAWRSQQAWIGRFSAAVSSRGTPTEPRRVHQAARELWPWLGWVDPEAVGSGHWDRLPRSHA